MKSVGSADPISPVEIADNNETEPINEELAVIFPQILIFKFSRLSKP